MKSNEKRLRSGATGKVKPKQVTDDRKTDKTKPVRKYPSKLGFHGTDKETELNPEE